MLESRGNEGAAGLSRRGFAAGLAALSVPGLAWAGATDGDADGAVAALLDRLTADLLRRSPEEASGLDDGDVAARARLDDRSLVARGADLAAARDAEAQLQRLDRAALGPRARCDYDVAVFVYRTLADLLARPGQVDLNLRPSPYVVSQMNGAYYWLPGVIGGQPLRNAADSEAWLARLAALATALDQESERIRHDAAAGVVPPGFVIARTLAQLQRLRDTPAAASPLIGPALHRAAAAGLPNRGAEAAAIFERQIAPALDRQMAALSALAPGASDIAGIWRLPDGEAFYAAALAANTTTNLAPADLHRHGLAQCEALAAELGQRLDAAGVAAGPLAARLTALDQDARFRVSDDDAGRAQIMAAAQGALARIIARLPQAFRPFPLPPPAVERMDPAIEAGSPGAFYSGGDPGAIRLNLGVPSEHPLWRLPTLIHHEGVPGHHYQASALDVAAGLPRFRRLVRFSAHTEGWALYAESLADELGVYADDPFGRIGALQSQLFRAARIVVDTGIHHHRWTREQAVAWMVEHAGEQQQAMAREVVRYCVYPGQACSFKVGADRIHAVREAAKRRLGARFRLADFHDLVLASGPVPMSVLETMAAAWPGGTSA